MTQITMTEMKFIFFGIVFLGVIGAFLSLYSNQPIEQQQYGGQQNVGISTTATEDSWISGLLSNLPEPFNDPAVAIVSAIFIIPVSVILVFISLRALKDLITQWV